MNNQLNNFKTKVFSIGLLLISITLFSQVPRQKVLLEVGTGTWCSSCPAVVSIIHQLEAADANIAVVEYHINDVYENAGSLIRKNFYNFPFYPTTYYDSNHIGIDDWNLYSVHYSNYEARNNTLSSFSLVVSGDYDTNTISGNIYAEKVASYAGSNLVLHMIVTESDIPVNWYGETEVDYVERSMFPDGNGTTIDFSSKQVLDIPFSIDIDASWVADNCNLVYFIQDNDTKEVLQADEIKVTEIINLSVNDQQASKSSFIYPNPIVNELSIHTSNPSSISDIKIYNSNGILVFKQNNYSNSIDLEELTQGVYFLSYNEGAKNTHLKLIKQ